MNRSIETEQYIEKDRKRKGIELEETVGSLGFVG
jgi:hypothetical protein